MRRRAEGVLNVLNVLGKTENCIFWFGKFHAYFCATNSWHEMLLNCTLVFLFKDNIVHTHNLSWPHTISWLLIFKLTPTDNGLLGFPLDGLEVNCQEPWLYLNGPSGICKGSSERLAGLGALGSTYCLATYRGYSFTWNSLYRAFVICASRVLRYRLF